MDSTDKTRYAEIAVQDAVSECYETIRYAKDYSVAYQSSWFNDMVSLVSKKGLVLDIGCGIGYLAEFMPASDIVGFDVSQGMLSKARNRMNKLVCGDALRLPFRDESFDAIFCRSLLHHLAHPQQGVYEIDRVLKMNGLLIVSEPIQSVLSNIPRKLVKGERHFSDIHKDFELKTLVDMLHDRFSVERVKHFGYIAYPMLGFPDVVDPLRYLPFKKAIAIILIYIDVCISRIPLLKTQSYGVTIKASKRE